MDQREILEKLEPETLRDMIIDLSAALTKEKLHWSERLSLCVRHGYYDAEHNDGECIACSLEENNETLARATLAHKSQVTDSGEVDKDDFFDWVGYGIVKAP